MAPHSVGVTADTVSPSRPEPRLSHHETRECLPRTKRLRAGGGSARRTSHEAGRGSWRRTAASLGRSVAATSPRPLVRRNPVLLGPAHSCVPVIRARCMSVPMTRARCVSVAAAHERQQDLYQRAYGGIRLTLPRNSQVAAGSAAGSDLCRAHSSCLRLRPATSSFTSLPRAFRVSSMCFMSTGRLSWKKRFTWTGS